MPTQPAYQLTERVWRIPVGPFDFVNSFAILEDDGGVTLIDTGMPSSLKRIEAGLAAIGKAFPDVHRVVLTHAHGDHVGGAAKVKEKSDAVMAISAIDAPFAREGYAPPRDGSTLGGKFLNLLGKKGNKFAPVVIGEEFADGDVLPVGGGLRVYHTPGHSPGHVALRHEADGVLITGDSIWNVRKMKWSVRAFCTDIKLNQQTANILGELDYEIAAFTHGKHVTQNARETVRRFLAEAKRDA
ncbi:MAG: MBL fold metallo-hydrolase [Catenulispora sp. 13_1_20CM_3_70_7]|jgi:glyoxylase-like metal-dependent hydrolase (beta-lactamase superfamily II)|nr:MBL fold metallo-hydrolase [Catenulisporales bacterium]OLE20981.1 MAG: MBL fold metallo-hydrolase [Catenulispora sp. 13_1_20CM_3_70_7]